MQIISRKQITKNSKTKHGDRIIYLTLKTAETTQFPEGVLPKIYIPFDNTLETLLHKVPESNVNEMFLFELLQEHACVIL